ncbi:unnamed protein product [Danaus chrysippus]|uniref:(African queen) hypothetical protein n=1 Tax=Danaus chrysippus TaxID=151541 RepID=A0A8J2QN59_9NEOP|nr:unnamed protein product [Danaus chrysippus]
MACREFLVIWIGQRFLEMIKTQQKYTTDGCISDVRSARTLSIECDLLSDTDHGMKRVQCAGQWPVSSVRLLLVFTFDGSSRVAQIYGTHPSPTKNTPDTDGRLYEREGGGGGR